MSSRYSSSSSTGSPTVKSSKPASGTVTIKGFSVGGPQRITMNNMTVADVCSWLQDMEHPELVSTFRSGSVDGSILRLLMKESEVEIDAQLEKYYDVKPTLLRKVLLPN